MNEEYINRTALAWGVSPNKAKNLLATNYQQSVRLNPFKVKKATIGTLKKQTTNLSPISWAANCYTAVPKATKLSQLSEFNKGEFILQNASSFIPVLELNPIAGDYILDMAAAPGGKSSHIAAISNNKANLVLNDTSRTRFFKMKKLMALQGVSAEYSLRDGRFLTKVYGTDVFDKILLDAPCSGEANLKEDDGNWNLSTIKRLAKLQGMLLSQAVDLLKPGGTLVYSTCTIAPEENEGVIDTVLRHKPQVKVLPTSKYPVSTVNPVTSFSGKQYDTQVNNCLRLLPSATCKPFFIAKLTKTSGSNADNSYDILKQYHS